MQHQLYPVSREVSVTFQFLQHIGLRVIELPEAVDEIAENDILTLDNDTLRDETTGKSYPLPPMDDYVRRVLEKGGLLEALK